MNKEAHPSTIIRGCWQLAADHSQQDVTMQPILDAIECGFTTFDCGDIYLGVEELLGKAVKNNPKQKLRIHTKFVPDIDRLQQIDRTYVEHIIDRSLKRLQVKYNLNTQRILIRPLGPIFVSEFWSFIYHVKRLYKTYYLTGIFMKESETIHDKNRWNIKTGLSSRMECLHQRQQIISAIRDDLFSQNFLEVETPLLVKATCPDLYIDSVLAGDGYLITSTEYQVKRMIVGGFKKVFTLTKNFRANDRGRYHSTEFTMLEWGRAFETLHEIEEDTIRFIRKAFHKLYPSQNSLIFNGDEINFISTPWERLTVREAFKNHLGMKDLGDFSLTALLSASNQVGFSIPDNFKDDQSLVISYLLDGLQSHLGKRVPTFLHEWPTYLNSSAPTSLKDVFLAERSELYIGGVEIANGFPFLRDSKQQQENFKSQLQKRIDFEKPSVVIDEKYIESLKDLPPGAGMALGVDRLVMVLTGATKLSDVQSFDWDEL